MGVTNRSRKLFLAKQKLLAKSPNTRTIASDYNAMHILLSHRTLSITSCRWASNMLLVLRGRYSAVEHGSLLEHLEKMLASAFDRARDRKEGREEAKRTKPGRKPLQSLPELPAIDDPWNAIDTSFLEADLDAELDAAVKTEAK